MIKINIRKNATLIRQHLIEKGECSIEQIKKDLKLQEEDIIFAIGWLVKEESIFILKEDNTLLIDLNFDWCKNQFKKDI